MARDDAAFKQSVELSRLQDPTPMFRNLSVFTGISVEDLQHHALVRWSSAGAEALISIEPQALRELYDARQREDWPAVAGLIDWLIAGLE